MRLYLDNCFLNRPFDDQSSDRIRLETEALKIVLSHIDFGRWTLVGSSILNYEIGRIADVRRREALQEIVSRAVSENVILNEEIFATGQEIQNAGVGGLDAMHLACAAKANIDAFLTTDDRLVRKASRLPAINYTIALPLDWLQSEAGKGNL